MKTPASCFAVALALGTITLTPGLVRAQDLREEGPIEIEKCRRIDKPGSYKLVKNLTFTGTTGTCLPITASFVTINLAGFTISGPNTFGTAAIETAPSTFLTGIAVRNGSISGFTTGVDLGLAFGLASGSASIVEGLRVVGASIPQGNVGINAAGIVRGNTVFQVGVGPGGPGVGISAAGTVTGNYVTANGHGMEIGQGSTVIGNTAFGNRVEGITVDCPSNVTDNTAVDTVDGPNLTLNGAGCNNTNNVAP